MIIGFTGTRHGMTDAQIEGFSKYLADAEEFHHGDCVGADWQAADAAWRRCGVKVVCHPPTESGLRAWTDFNDVTHKPRPYLARNRAIVDACHHLIACPQSAVEEQRSGTWSTVRYAVKIGKPVTIIFPDGSRAYLER